MSSVSSNVVNSSRFVRDALRFEGILPLQAFQIQYIMMPQPPALPPGYDPFLNSQGIEVYCWSRAKPWEIKTIPLSTHVNAAYALEDLQQVRKRVLVFSDECHTSVLNILCC